MKHLLITTIAAVLVVGCGESQSPEPPTAKAPDISIHAAARYGNIEAVKQHMAAGTDVDAKNVDGWTPMLFAAARGHKELAELLIANGADVNVKSKNGGTPLHRAASKGQKEIVELLIAKGADVNAKNDRGDTPLDSAIKYKRTETAALLRKHGGKTGAELPSSTLSEAASRGALQEVKDFLAKGADVNAKGRSNVTPLHAAAAGGHKEIVGLLIAKGADVNAKDKTRGETPLHYAAINGHKELAELLIDSGAEVNAKNVHGTTPLGCTIRHPETADLLRKHGGKTGEELKAEGK